MPSVVVNTKKFKSLLKTFKDLNKSSERAVVFNFRLSSEGSLTLEVQTDFLSAVATIPVDSAETEGRDHSYLFYPEHLLKIPFYSETLSLSWTNNKSPLTVVSGKLKTHLKVSVGYEPPNILQFKNDFPTTALEYNIIAQLVRYSNLPFAYFKASNKDTLPIRFHTEDGLLSVSCEDGYSMSKIKTSIQLEIPIDLKIPRFLLMTLFPKALKEEAPSKIGGKGFQVSLFNGTVNVIATTVKDPVTDLEEAVKSQSWKSSCKFDIKKLISCLETMVYMIPDKDRSGAVVKVSISKENMNLDVFHREVGEGSVKGVDGVTNTYNENSIREFVSSQHPIAFSEYTSLLGTNSIVEGEMHLNNRATLFKGVDAALGFKVFYFFPAVLG